MRTRSGWNQLPARCRASLHRRLAAADGVEDVDHLGEQGDARIERDRRAEHAVGPAAAVPVLVEAGDAGGDAFAEAELAGDVGAARAARSDQLVA